MTIAYSELYLDGYFAHAPGRNSFRADFPTYLTTIAQRLGVRGVVDFGAGSGALSQTLAENGLSTRAFDFKPGPGVTALDLTSPLTAELRNAACGDWDGPWLSTCFDALEHIGQGDLGQTLHNLNELTAEHLFVTISHRPSSNFNRFHASVLPPETWLALFDAAGFEPEQSLPIESDEAHPARVDDPLIAHWLAINPFRMTAPFASSRFLLRKKNSLPPAPEFLKSWQERFPWLSGTSWRPQGSFPTAAPMAFLILHMQDFLILFPIAEASPRDGVSFLVGAGDYEPNALNLRSIASFLLARGYRVLLIEDHRQTVAALPPDTVLLTASESTASAYHLISSGVVAAARARGLGTLQLQHGILVADNQWQPFSCASERMLAWSPQHAEAMREAGCADLPPMTVTGCPKFDLAGSPAPWDAVLGSWTARWSRRCVIAANTQWHAHGQHADTIDEALLAIARRHEDWLFLMQAHPSYPTSQSGVQDLPDNVALLSSPALLVMDRPLQGLLRVADALLATQSTSLLDASVLDLPVAVIDTKHPNPYRHLEPLEASRIALPGSARLEPRFRDAYLDPSTRHAATRLVLDQLDAARRTAAPAPGFAGWSDAARHYASLLRSGAKPQAPVSRVPDGKILPLPFDAPTKSGSIWGPNAAIRLTNGNRWCSAFEDGIGLHPNPPGRPAVVLRFEGLDLSGQALLGFLATTGPACPGLILRIDFVTPEGDEEAAQHTLGPSASLKVRIPLAERRAHGIVFSLSLREGAASASSAGLRLKQLRLLPASQSPA